QHPFESRIHAFRTSLRGNVGATLRLGRLRSPRLRTRGGAADSGEVRRLRRRGLVMGAVRVVTAPISGRQGVRPLAPRRSMLHRAAEGGKRGPDARARLCCRCCRVHLAGAKGILVSPDPFRRAHPGCRHSVPLPLSIPARSEPHPAAAVHGGRAALHRQAHPGDLRYPACPLRARGKNVSRSRSLRPHAMISRDPEKNFDALWTTFHNRYPFFALRKVDWNKQYETYRPKVTPETSEEELFDIFCRMLDPLDDGHVELKAKLCGHRKFFTAEKKPRFHREFKDGK